MSSRTTSDEQRLFIIDTDAGIDDAQAILMALADPSVNVIAITTTHGNANVKQVVKNVLRILKVAKRLDVSKCIIYLQHLAVLLYCLLLDNFIFVLCGKWLIAPGG